MKLHISSNGDPVPPTADRIPASLEPLGNGTNDVLVSQHVEGLEANKLYHWRVVVTGTNGETVSPDHTFIYDTADASGVLPDGRGYEMVTPARKNGALIGDLAFGLRADISADGQRVIEASVQCYADAQSCTAARGTVGTPFEFSRTGDGWHANALLPAASEFPILSTWGVAADSGSALLSSPNGATQEDDLIAREPNGTVRPLGPMTPPSAGGQEIISSGFYTTSGFGRTVWIQEARSQLWAFDETLSGFQEYEYAGVANSQPLLVPVSGGPASHDLIGRCGITPAEGPGTLSEDGRKVFFTVAKCEAGGSGANSGNPIPVAEVFARIDNAEGDAHTIAISQPVASHSCTSPECLSNIGAGNTVHFRGARFEAASDDGSKVFFTSPQQLTNEASEDSAAGDTAAAAEGEAAGCHVATGPTGCNLYEFECGTCQAESDSQLIDVSAGAQAGEGPKVRGVVAASADGSHVYFVAEGVLTQAANQQGQLAKTGANNLYVFERDAAHPSGQIAYVVGLPTSDEKDWRGIRPGAVNDNPDPANITPDGRYLVFVSHGRLTTDDTSRTEALQVFRYDSATGELLRVSVGAHGFNDNGNGSAPSPCGGNICALDARIAPGRPATAIGPSRRDVIDVR